MCALVQQQFASHGLLLLLTPVRSILADDCVLCLFLLLVLVRLALVRRLQSGELQALAAAAKKAVEAEQAEAARLKHASQHGLVHFAQVLVVHSSFNSATIFLVVLSCLALALDNPLQEPGTALHTVLEAGDLFFCGAFTVEAVVKMLAYGVHKVQGATVRVRVQRLSLSRPEKAASTARRHSSALTRTALPPPLCGQPSSAVRVSLLRRSLTAL